MNLWNGDCLEVMREMAARGERVHAVVCDPPYHLTSIVKRFSNSTPAKFGTDGAFQRASRGFMGKVWDGGDIAFKPDVWRLCWDLLPPGGHLVAFGGTRTYHRLAAAIEDAGFEIRDAVMWHYGCLDDRTDCLTRRGWLKPNEINATDEVCQWDSTTGALSWTPPQAVHFYPFEGELVALKNRHTDQRLTPNHRVYAKITRHSRNPASDRYEVLSAQKLHERTTAWRADLPLAGVLHEGKQVDPDFAYLAGWWLTDAWLHGDGKACMFSQCKPKTLVKLRAALAPHHPSEYTKKAKKPEHENETTFYLTGPLAVRLQHEFPERRLPWTVLGWDIEARSRLLEALLDGDGSQQVAEHTAVFWSQSADRRDVVLALALSLGWRAYSDERNGCVNMNRKTSTTQIQSKHKPETEHYSGEVWCLTVPTGAFVARRSGRPFITGNSGFPKSHNVARGIDARLGVAGTFGAAKSAAHQRWIERGELRAGRGHDGWQRPWMADPEQVANAARAYEPGSPEAAQWVGWGTALKPATEIIAVARKPLEGTVADNVLAYGAGAINIDDCRVPGVVTTNPLVRNAGALQEGRLVQGPTGAGNLSEGRWPANLLHDGSDEVVDAFPNSAARFFYSAKASPIDRGAGNTHPTVKPTALMEWLVRLVTPPGGFVLDPFMGSGSTGKGALAAGMRFIGIEREEEYFRIAQRRLDQTPMHQLLERYRRHEEV